MLVRRISEKYDPEPGRNDILSDVLIIAIRRFSNSCRWKEFWRLKKLEEIREKSNSIPKSVDCESFFDSEVRIEAKRERLHLRGQLARLRFISQNFLPKLCRHFYLIAWGGS